MNTFTHEKIIIPPQGSFSMITVCKLTKPLSRYLFLLNKKMISSSFFIIIIKLSITKYSRTYIFQYLVKEKKMEYGLFSLLPPFITLIFAFASHRILFSLTSGVIVAACIATHYSFIETIKMICNKIISVSGVTTLFSTTTFVQSEKPFMFLFLIFLGIIITLISHSGGAFAYGNYCKKKLEKIATPKINVQTSSLFLSCLLFIDDYFSSFTVGAVMQPLTDFYKIPRIKLAFLISSMAAPLCALFPLSSWGATIISQLTTSGITETIGKNSLIIASPLMVYLSSVPFIFHSFFIVLTAFFIVKNEIAFGPMLEHEKIAQKTGNLFAGKTAVTQRVRFAHEENKKRATLFDFIFPIVSLFVFIIGAILYSGDFFLFGGQNSFLESFIASPSMLGLFLGSFITLIFALIFFLFEKKVTIAEIPSIFYDGTMLMISTIGILILAFTLGSFMKNELQTGVYLASIVPTKLPITLLPFIFSTLAALIAFFIGSAFGTMVILFPIAIPMLLTLLQVQIPVPVSELSLLFPLVGGIISGSVLGDHISPIADVTFLASSSAGAHHLDYIKAQLYYVLPIGFISMLTSLLAGLTNNLGIFNSWLISFTIGTMGIAITLWFLNKKRKSDERNAAL